MLPTLETFEKHFSQFASNNTAIDIREQGKAMVDAAGTLEGQLIAAKRAHLLITQGLRPALCSRLNHTYSDTKSFISNTYKKPGEGVLKLRQKSGWHIRVEEMSIPHQ